MRKIAEPADAIGKRAATVAQVEDAYLPLRALAAYSGLSIRTLRSYLVHPDRPLPYYRIGAKILVRRSEFDAWAAGFRVTVAATVDQTVRNVLADLGIR